MTESELLQVLSTCGRVSKLCLAGDTLHAARFAFVEYQTPEEAQIALRLNGLLIGKPPKKLLYLSISLSLYLSISLSLSLARSLFSV